MNIDCGLLRLDLDDGSLSVRTGDGEWEWLGHIEDPVWFPPEHEDDYVVLLDRWRDALGGGHERESLWTYENLCRPSAN